MAPQSILLSNLAVSFGAKVQDAYVVLSLGSQSLETCVQTTQASRLNWTEDYELLFDSSNPSCKELRIEVCSKHPARRLDPCLARTAVPIQLGHTLSGAVRQEVDLAAHVPFALLFGRVSLLARLSGCCRPPTACRSLLNSARFPEPTTTVW